MSNKIQLSRIPSLHPNSLPNEARVSLIHAKNALRGDEINLKNYTLPITAAIAEHGRNDPAPLPTEERGCIYLEFDAGSSRELNDKGEPKRGRKRLVLEFHVKSRTVIRTFYTEDHYTKHTFWLVTKRT